MRIWSLSAEYLPACAAADVSIAAVTVHAVAEVWAQFADHGTGRNTAVTRARIAAEVGCSTKTVARAWRVLQEGGFAVEISRGHGNAATPSYGCRPSIWHLVSRPNPVENVDNVPLPPIGGFGTSTPVGSNSPRVCKHTPESNSHQTKPRRRWRATPRPIAIQRLAGQLAGHPERAGEPRILLGPRRSVIQGLGRVHVGAVCDAITAAGIDPAQWTASKLMAALDADMRASGLTWPDELQRPAAFLACRLRRLTRSTSTTEPLIPTAAPVTPLAPGPLPYVRPAPVAVTTDQRKRITQAQAQIREDLACRKAARLLSQTGRITRENTRGASIEFGECVVERSHDERNVTVSAR
ncbi:rep protein [Mycobacteroides salmoniphilum]|uniref:rep protein n=1 Tax=Mycobacteroides salmoniphilum TaxID=404941 RepID=UPI001065A6E0|nr:rep protein [Mycobacteroides salmoniphilum]